MSERAEPPIDGDRETCFVDEICFVCCTTRLDDCEGHAP
jgi:hypothetical protein